MKKTCVLVIAASLGACWAIAQLRPAAAPKSKSTVTQKDPSTAAQKGLSNGAPKESSTVALKDAYEIHAGGAPRKYELALDEVSVKDSSGRREVRKIAAQSGASTIGAIRSERAKSGADVSPILYERGKARSEFTRAYVTRRILVKLAGGTRAVDVASVAGLRLVDSPAYAPDLAVLEAGSEEDALAAMDGLRAATGVLSADVMLARQKQKSEIVNDISYPNQWNLHNSGQGGGALWMDLNVEPAWSGGFTGSGVNIAIMDDGVQYTHPDLQPNYNASLSYDFNGDGLHGYDNDPAPLSTDPHGTACAGLAAARGNNNIGISGVAYLAGLVGIRIVAAPTTDQQEADAFSWRNDAIQVKSSSWNVVNDGSTVEGPGPLAKAALIDGVTNGRGGKGTIYLFSGGNGLVNQDNSNYDGYANAIQVIAVGAVSDAGFRSFYSEPGANLAVSAPSNGGLHNASITTTDLMGGDGFNDNITAGVSDLVDNNYTAIFGGSSAACPQVAGVAALMLQANPNLGWRDVKEILMRSARPVHASDPDWLTNGGGFHFNHKYGAGLVDAAAAVTLAQGWANLPTETTTQLSDGTVSAIPDYSATGVTRTFNFTNTNFRVEHVEVTVNITHTNRGDLEIILTSPSGMTSRLAEHHSDFGNDYADWTFTSVRHWGENAIGNWTVKVADRDPNSTGTLNGVLVKLHGTTGAAARIAGTTATFVSESNLPANTAADPGETVTFNLGLKNIGGTSTASTLTATLLPIGGVTNPSGFQTYGALTAGGAAVTKSFTFQANGSCGTMVNAVLQLQQVVNGVTTPLGFATVTIPLGKSTTTLSPLGGAITLVDNAIGSPSPSSVTVSGLTGRVQNMTVLVSSLTHGYPDDVGLLLDGPSALQMQVFRGGPTGVHTNVSYTFDGNAPVYLPSFGTIPTGTYKPFDQYPSTRPMTQDPGDEEALTLGEFNGVPANGLWRLYTQDFDPGSSGSIGSWRLTFTTMDCTDNVLFSQSAVTVAEEGGVCPIVVRRTGGKEGTATVHYATADGTATAGSDYAATSGNLTFLPGELQKTISIPITDDLLTEGAETFTVTLSAPTGNTQLGAAASQVATVTILASDPAAPVVIAPTAVTVNEGATATFTVSRSTATTAGTVNYTTAPGAAPAATAGTDYTTTSGTLSFAINEFSKTIDVPVLFDNISDTGEHFTVTLSSPTSGISLGATTQSTVTIADVAPTPVSISPATLTAAEGTLATVTVSRTTSATAGTVAYATANGPAPDAGNPGDYTAASGTLSFAVGELSKTISVPVAFDSGNDGGEHFTVTISSATGGLSLGATTASIVTISDVPPTTVSISPTAPSVAEGATATVTVSRSTSATAGTVNYATAPGAAPAATAGTDYTTTSGTLSFAVGETSKTIDVPVLFDNVSDTGEHFTITLSSPTGGITLGTTTSTVTITDVPATTVAFSASTTSVNEGATATLTVNRSGGSTAGTVNYATAAGTATAGTDYTTTSGTLSFAAGETSKTIDVPVLFDSVSDLNETFTVTLSSPTGGITLGSPVTNTVTITNVPPTTVSISPTAPSVAEGATATVTVSRSTGATAGTVNYATAPGAAPAATAGTDYTTTSGTLSFAVNELSKTIDVPVLFDNVSDTGEHFTITLSSPTGGITLGTTTSTVTITDVPATTVAFSTSTTLVNEGTTATLTVNRSSGSTAGTVNYVTAAGTATAGSDYTTTSGTLSFAVGETSKTIDVPTLTDGVFESNETFTVTLSGPTGGITLGSPATNTVTIADVTPTPVVISPASTSADEGTVVTFTVSRSTASTTGTVQYATSNGTASAAAGDYTVTNGTLSFAVGELSKTFNVPVLFDNLAEPNETFAVTLNNPAGGISLGSPASSTVTINDVPATPVVISPAPTTVSEGTVITFTISRTTGATPGTINYTTTAGTATAGSDYTATSGTLTFAINELSKTFTVPVLFDSVVEPNENFVVSLNNPTGGITVGTPSTCTVTITDVAATPVNISPASIQVNEGSQLTLTVSRASGATAGTVAYATSNGTAIAGSDYTSTSGTLSFAVNELSKTFDVPILSDALTEPFETFTVTLINPTAGISLGATTTSTVTISDPPTPVAISPAATTVAEGTPITLTVSRTSGSTAGTVAYATTDGTATAGNGDYTATGGTLSFAVNELSKTFNVPVLYDSASESNETFTVTLSNPTAGITLGATTTSTVTITDVPATPVAIAPAAAQLVEGATATFTVSRISGATAGTVDYATSNGTATSGSDYTAMSGTLSFAVNELSKTLNVPILSDALDEPYETFTVALSNPTGGITLGATTTSTITISDPPTPVVISPATTTVAEGTQITFTVTRTSGTTAGTVNYATSNGTATSGSDYIATSGTLNFALNELSKTINVPVLFDSASESNENFSVALSNPTAGIALGATTTSTVTITNVPATPVVIAPAATTVFEGGTVTFTVSRASGATAGTVNYATSPGTATSGSDYTATSGTLSFAVNELSKTFDVPVLSDALDEPYETFSITLSTPTGGITLGATTTSVVTISDPPTPVVISPVTTSVAEGDVVIFTVSRTSGTTAGTVNYGTSDGSATAAGGDYSATSGTLNFAVNELSKTINVPVLFDSVSESDETFTVALSSPTAGIALGGTTTSTITITDLPATSVFISPAAIQVTEGTTVTFTVSRASGEIGGTVDYATSPGTASGGSDYTTTSGTLSFAVGELSKTFDVPVLSDALDEPYETFTVTLNNPTGGITLGATTTSIVTISDPPTPVVISPATTLLAEGSQLTLTVSRTSGTTAGTVNYATIDGSATAAGGDYASTSGTLNFAINELSKTINVPVLFDSASESNETFTVTLSNPTAGIALGATTTSTVTITDVPATPVVISPATIQVTEGATVTLTVSRASAATAGTVNYATSNGTATSGSDYTATSGTLNFAVNELSKTFDVPILSDALDEPYETFTVALGNPTGGITLGATTTSAVTISDPPTPVAISPAATTVAEGAQVTLTVSRTSGTTAGTVNYATSNGTASAAGGDYTSTSGTLNFALNELSKTINVPVLFDSASESNESFTVTLSNPTAGIALGATTTSTVTITDVPATPVAISPATIQVTEGATVTFTVSRASGATAGTVNYATSNGTAAAGSDYTATSGTLNFAVNELSKTFDVPILSDALPEPFETFDVTLSNPSGGITLGTTTASTVTINDPPTPVVIAPAFNQVAEGDVLTFIVTRATAGTAGSVDYATSDGTATAGADYTATGGTLSFAINEFSKVFNVPVHFDGVAEPDETFTATLSNPSAGISLGATIATTVTITDVPATPVVISPASTQVTEGATVIFTVSRASGATAGTVAYATSDGAAIAGADYTATSGTLSFAINELTKTFSVPVLNDSDNEPSETFNVTLSNPTGGITLGATTTSTVTISNSLTPVVISPVSILVDEAATQLTFTVSRVSGTTAGTVAYATGNGSATAGSDYTATSGTLNFAVNELSKTFNVPILDDNVYEPDENFHVTLGNPTGGLALGATTVSTVTIHDGDTDADGLPDDYETAHGLNPNSAADASLDSDGDGFTNLEEFIMGTDPRDRNSTLVVAIARSGNDIRVTFPTVAGRIYTVQCRNNLMFPCDVLQGGITGDGNPVTVTDFNAGLQPERFYQVMVEAPLP